MLATAVVVTAFVAVATASSLPESGVLGFRPQPSETTARSAQLEADARRNAASALGLADKQVAASGPKAGCAPRELGIVSMDYAIFPWMPSSDGTVRRRAVVTVRLTGCYGTFPDARFIVGTGVGAESSPAASATPEQDAGLLAAALSSAIADFRQSRTANAGFAANLLRYGVPLGDAERSAFVAIQYDRGGATVVRLDPVGTAAQAGLRVGDHISSINGIAVTPENLASLVAAADASGHWTVAGAREASFDVQGAQWYETHGMPRDDKGVR